MSTISEAARSRQVGVQSSLRAGCLTVVTYRNAAGTVGNLTYEYDSAGNRSSVGGLFCPHAFVQTSFMYDGLNTIQEVGNAGAPANLLTGLGIDENLIRTDSTGAQSVFLTDTVGSVIALASPTGALEAQYTYEPFDVTGINGTTNGSSVDYTGGAAPGGTVIVDRWPPWAREDADYCYDALAVGRKNCCSLRQP